MSKEPKCNQSTGVTTNGWPSAEEVAALQQAKYTTYRENQRRMEEATARAKVLRAKEAEERAARTREATQRSLFWHDI